MHYTAPNSIAAPSRGRCWHTSESARGGAGWRAWLVRRVVSRLKARPILACLCSRAAATTLCVLQLDVDVAPAGATDASGASELWLGRRVSGFWLQYCLGRHGRGVRHQPRACPRRHQVSAAVGQDAAPTGAADRPTRYSSAVSYLVCCSCPVKSRRRVNAAPIGAATWSCTTPRHLRDRAQHDHACQRHTHWYDGRGSEQSCRRRSRRRTCRRG